MTVAFVVALIFLLSSCGGGGQGSFGSTASKADYIRKADAICSEDLAKVQALSQPTDLAGLGAYVDSVLPIVRDERTRLGALTAPSSDTQTIDSLLGQLDSAISELGQLRDAANRGEATGVSNVNNALMATNDSVTQSERSYGMAACAD